MSLINDALRRAKQARPEQPAPTTPNLPFRPVELEAQPARRGVGLLLPVSLAVVALLTLLFLWELLKRESSRAPSQSKGELAVAARTLPPSEPATAEPPAVTSSPEPVALGSGRLKSVSEKPSPAPVNSTSPNLALTQGTSGTSSVASGEDSVETNSAAATEPAPPTPAPLKLQSIVFNPKRPSAMINGRVVFLGDRIRDLRVIAIHRDYVSLAGGGRTNLLSLEP